MANEIQLSFGASGATLYAVVINSTGLWYNPSTPGFEALNVGHWGNYAISMVQVGSLGQYEGTFPPAIAQGVYNVTIYSQGGGSPSPSDTLTGLAGGGTINWDGTQPVVVSNSAQTADRILGRNNAGGSDGGRTVSQSMQTIRNKFTISGTTLTVFAEDDITPLYVAILVTNPTATPITQGAPTT